MSRTWKVLVGAVCLLLAVLRIRWLLLPQGMANELGIAESSGRGRPTE